MRSCLLGLRIAEDLELDESERAVVYYVGLLAVGWVATRTRMSSPLSFGDDIQLRADRHLADSVGARFVISHVGRGEPATRRAVRLGSLLVSGRDSLAAMETTHCMGRGAVRDASRSGNRGARWTPARVRALGWHGHARWDRGRGDRPIARIVARVAGLPRGLA